MRRQPLRFTLAIFALYLATSGTRALAGEPAAAGSPPSTAAWRLDPLWDDGNAELCAYDVTWPRYGARYHGRALLVLVKEPWAPDLHVKADTPRGNGFDVLKLNHVRDVRTGIYTYHQMASVYFRRDDARLEKVAATSSEACGVTTAYKVGDGELAVRSYFDGVGDRAVAWPAGALPQDALPALLRDWVVAPPPGQLLVFPSLLDSKLATPKARRLQVSRRDAAEVEEPAGRFAAVELRLEGEAAGGATGEQLSYLFERAAPHRLLELRGSDGTLYRLARCGRIKYWEMHGPGGEEWLPAAVR
ncbi:MAG TPA: hypothetical protein VGV61_09550 [Thermoanaerobaculia bacterium]|jgi:hypothetical protein|nr:hypothetical protein [Thermoanaerobaculia bacterium]